ncbi:MAG TPA: rhomboid family intramembrane serine protease [Syntrophomonadaceae bacterium]|nr:rhomboid family intramembrane serine protease [Syntrophomonadaceae bacterium]
MVPLRDSTPSHHFPLVTVSLIIVNLYVFYYQTTLGTNGMEQLIYTLGLVPSNYSHQLLLINYLPFVTSMFLHGSWMHVIGNMWILWLFGDNVEDRMGKFKFLLFYLLCGVIAAFTHYYVNAASTVPVVGASGAVAGVMGAYFLMFKKAKVLTFVPPFFLFNLPAWIYLGFWALSQLYSGTAGLVSTSVQPIAFWAHIGGFASGMILYRFFLKSNSYSYNDQI